MAQLFESSRDELQQMMTKSNVDVSTVADRLFENKVINQSTFEDVKSRKSNEEKIGALSDAVTQLGRTAYDSCSEIIKNLTVEVQEPPLAERVEATSVPSSDTAATPSLSQLLGNMNLHFVNTIELEPEYLCPITSEILLDVYQTNCCGNRISQTAFLHLSNSNAPCPNCRAPSFTADPDIPFKKKLRNKRVRCEYGDHGCKWEGCLDQLVEHNDKNQDYHRTLKKIKSIAPQEFILNGYNDFRKSQKTWYSPAFYTGHSGYRMQFRIEVERDDHLGLYVYLMKGVYDDILPFPFRGTVIVQLIKQEKDYQCSVEFNESVDIKHTTRVLDGDRQKHGYGYPKFYPLKKLFEFLEDDSLRFRVTVETTSNKDGQKDIQQDDQPSQLDDQQANQQDDQNVSKQDGQHDTEQINQKALKQDTFPEMEIIAEREITMKEARKFEWKEFGFSLHIPDDVYVLDANIKKITIAVSLKGQCCFPESHELVSAVYWIFSSVKFSGPVTIGIEHCANLSIMDSELCFVSTHCTEDDVSYNFMQVGGGTFAKDSKFGYLSTTHFSGFAIVKYIPSFFIDLFMPWQRSNYKATLYLEDEREYSEYEALYAPSTLHLFIFLVTPCLEASQQAAVKKYSKGYFLDDKRELISINSMDFTFEKKEIKIEWSQKLHDDVKVTPMTDQKIAWLDVLSNDYSGIRFKIECPAKHPRDEVELQIIGAAGGNSSMSVPIKGLNFLHQEESCDDTSVLVTPVMPLSFTYQDDQQAMHDGQLARKQDGQLASKQDGQQALQDSKQGGQHISQQNDQHNTPKVNQLANQQDDQKASNQGEGGCSQSPSTHSWESDSDQSTQPSSVNTGGQLFQDENVKEKVSKTLDSSKDITFKQLRISKLIFYGTPRAGKTTLKEQLLRYVKGVPLLPRGSMQKSTNIAQICESIFVERVILTGEKSNEWKWSVQELDDIAKALLQCMNNEQLQCEPGISHSQTSIKRSAADHSFVSKNDVIEQKTLVEQPRDAGIPHFHEIEAHFKTDLKEDILQMEQTQMIDQKRPPVNLEDIKNMFRNAVKTSDWTEVVSALNIDKAMFLQVIDCGGQPSFQEIFPLLISGPSVAIIIFKLTDNLEEKHLVPYQPQPGNTRSKEWNDSYVVKDIIFHAFSSFVPQSAHKNNKIPFLLLVGTHKDQLQNFHGPQDSGMSPEAKILNIAQQLNGWLCKSKTFECIQVTNTNDFITGIDNYSEEDIKLIRKKIEELILQLDTQDIPAPWLVFDFALHKYAQENKLCKVPKSVSKDLAKHCGVKNDEIENVLHYLHNDAGTLLYYSDIPKLNDYVITDFQLIIDSISKIIVEYFDESSECHKKYKDQFHQQGRLDGSVLKDVKDCLKKDELLSLLYHCHIISKINAETGRKNVYFMPSVLPKADKLPSDNKLPSNSFLVLFDDNGYCPVGLFCATTTSLIGVTNTPDYECEWKINDHEQQFRDKIHFSLMYSQNSYNVIFSAFPTHFEVCLKEPTEGLAEVMPKIKQMIYQNISDIIMKLCTDLHYSPPSYGFYCSYKHEGTEIQHPARCPFTEKCQQMECVQNGNKSSLTNEHKEWFLEQVSQEMRKGTKRSKSELSGKPTLKQLMVFPSVVKGVKKNIDIIQKTCTNYYKLGVLLLDDDNGDVVDALKQKNNRDPVEITKDVYKKWIDGTGRKPVTWKTLVDVLRDIELNSIADEIHETVNH